MDGTYETKINCMMRLMLWCTSEEMFDVVEYGQDVAVELKEQSKHAGRGRGR